MARPKKANPVTRLTLSLDAQNVAKLTLLTSDPTTGQAKYGARAQVIDALIANLLADFAAGKEETSSRRAMQILRKHIAQTMS